MRRYILFFALIFIMPKVFGQTNIYHQFSGSNAVWVFEKNTCVKCGLWPPQSDKHLYYYVLKGDTIFNSLRYHKLFRVDSSAFEAMLSFKGGIREDINRKVYLTDFLGQEHLLYDFSSTNIGDTIVRGFDDGQSQGSWTGTILTKDSVYLNDGTWRRAYYTTSITQTSIVIEGIGSNIDLVLGPYYAEFSSSSITCFHNENILIYNSDLVTSCYMDYVHVGIIENNGAISIGSYANPFSSETILQINKFLRNASLTVYNLYGEKVKQMDNLNGQTIIFHRDNLPGGLYLFHLTQDDKTTMTERFMITDN